MRPNTTPDAERKAPVRVEVVRVELARHAPADYDWPSAHEFDLGGES